MSLIRDRKSRSSGAYDRILGNKKLDNLISKVHATTISAGTELEKLILDNLTNAYVIDNNDEFNDVLDNKIIFDKQIYVIKKRVIKKSKLSNKKEPDFIVIENSSKKFYIIELKEGHIFDTKKSEGELSNLRKFSEDISPKIAYKTDFFICSFHENNKNEIHKGLKSKIPMEHIMTGDEFCKLLGLDYNKILEIRKKEINDNFDYFVEQLLEIPEIENKFEEFKIKPKNNNK